MVVMSLCNHLPRFIYLYLLLCLATWGSWAQKCMVYLMVDSVDQSTLLCYYQYKHNESGHPETINMLLQIGGKVQKFGSLARYHEDSLALTFQNTPQDSRLIMREVSKIRADARCKGRLPWVMYRNYPTGKVTITDRVFMDHYSSVEPSRQPTWQLEEEETLQLGGYVCHKATTTLHGRKWTVWYAPSLAYSEGPWLLNGLPGLVLKANDDSGAFSFTLQQVVQRRVPITFRRGTYTEAPRQQVLQARSRYLQNSSQYVKDSAVGSQLDEVPRSKAISHNPLRRR